jgi:hypothetical protein
MAFVQKDDAGIVITFTVYQEDTTTPYNLTGADANSMEMWFGPPSGEAIQKTDGDGVAITDAANGVVSYAVEADVFTVAGDWNVQCKWLESGLKRHSTVVQLEVYENVE